MNLRFQPLILAIGFTLGTVHAEEAESQIRFAQDNQLSGELVSFNGDRIIWKSPVLEEPASFLVKKVLEVTFPSETPAFEADHEATLTLKNGDVVRGQLVSVTDDEVQLGTWYAGTLKFRRVMVQSLSIDDRPTLFYRGPSGIEGWTQTGAKAWTYQANALRITGGGGIGRVVETPDDCRFLFTGEWRGDLRLAVNLFSDDLTTSDPQTGYRISFERRMISLQKLGAAQQIIGNIVQDNQLSISEKARFEVRVSRKQGLVTLLVDDRIIGNWQDPEVDPKLSGYGMQFSSQDGAALKLSRIEVSSWDGHTEGLSDLDMNGVRRFGGRVDPFNNRFGGQPEPVEKPVVEEEGRMALRNGDSIIGEVMAIEGGVIKIKTPHSEVSLPVSRLRTITLKPAALEEPKRNAGDVRAWFSDGSSIVFRLESMADGVITGYSQTFGTADFKAAAFNRIEFNVQMLQLEALRGSKDW
jgi:hypothetical protein